MQGRKANWSGVKWEDIEANAAYQGMDYQKRRRVAGDWFEQNVMTHPKMQGKTPEEIEAVRGRWRSMTDKPADRINPVTDPAKQLGEASARTGSTLARVGKWAERASGFGRMREHLKKMADEAGVTEKIPEWIRDPYQAAEGLADDAAEFWKGKTSEAWRMEQEKKFLTDAARPERSRAAWTSPAKIAGTVLNSAPQTVLGMGSGMLAAKGLIGAGMSPGLAGILGGALGEGGMAGADAAKTAEDTVMGAPEEMLAALPEYQEMLAEGRTREEARGIIARDAALKTGSIIGTGVGILGAPSGAAVGKLMGEAGEVGIKNFLKQAGLEAGQEIPQSALEKYQQNMIRRIYEDPSVDPMEGVAEAAVEGGVAGAAMGGGQAMVAGQGNAERGTRNAELEAQIDAELGIEPEAGETAGPEADFTPDVPQGPEMRRRPSDEKELSPEELKKVKEARTADLFYRKRISDAGRADLQARVRDLDSLEEVDATFSGGTDADKYARNFARLLEGDPKLGEQGFFSELDAETDESVLERRRNRKKIPVEAKGAEGSAFTPGDAEIGFDYAVIDAGDLNTSHSDTFQENPDFPKELQPRDRSRGALQEQVIRMSNTIMPERLGHSANVGDGAPIIGDDLVVESGNGRSIALRTAYKNGKGENYRKWLADNAAEFGLTGEQVAGVKNPVLVRVRKTNVDRHGFVKDANQSGLAGMSPSEQAGSDADRLTADDMGLLSPGADGDLRAESNRGFIDAFMGRLGPNEAASLLGSDGRINRAGIERMRSAVFARAYQDDVLIDLQAEATDNNIRNLLGALTGAAERFAKSRALDPSLPVAGEVTAAVRAIRDSRMTGQGVKEIVNQRKLDGSGYSKGASELALFMNENIRAPKKLEAVLRKIGDVAHENLMNRNQHALFGENADLTADEMITEGLQRAKETNYAVDERESEGGPGSDAAAGFRGLSEADIRESFKGRQVRKHEDGSFTVRLGNRRDLRIRQVERIDIDEAAFEIAYRRSLPAGLKAAGATGSYKDGVIKIARRGDKFTLGHESFHALKDMGMLSKAELKALEREAGKDEEAQARWIEDALLDREAYRERGVVYRMLQKLSDFLDGFVGLMRATSGGVVRGMESGKIYERGMRNAERGMERYAYGGRKAETADLAKLEKAQGMENAELARLKTGWFRGLDGEWKFEIDDSGAGTGPAWEAMATGEIRRAKLGDVLTHDALFEAYPGLTEMTVVIKEIMPPGVEASFVPQAGQIWINRKAIDAGRRVGPTILHEIQHAIQEQEGFAGGANLAEGSDAYRNAPGEIEARDVSERAGFSRAQRRGTAPYTSQKEYLDAEMYAVPREFEDIFRVKPARSWFQAGKEAVGEFRSNWKYKLFDYMRPIKDLLGEHAYIMNRMVSGTQASLEYMFEHGRVKWDGSRETLEPVDPNQEKQGFIRWFEQLGEDGTKFLMWATAQRAARLEAQGREKLIDAKKRARLEAYAGKTAKDGRAWAEINKEFQKFNQSVLDIVEQAGVIKRGAWANEDVFLPFYRVWEEDGFDFDGGPASSHKFLQRLKTLEGGEQLLDDPFKNIVRNWTYLISESIRNRARTEAFKEAKKRGLARAISGKDRMKYPNVLSILDGGRNLYFRVNDPFLYNAMLGARPKALDGVLGKIFATPKRLLTFGATIGGGFRLANFIRDTGHTAIIAKSFVPVWSSMKGFAKVMMNHPDYLKFRAAGGTFGSDYMKSDDPDSVARYMEKLMGEAGVAERILAGTGIRAVWRAWQKIGEASEQAARVEHYARLRKKGATNLEAAFAGKDLLDFSLTGQAPVVSFLVQTVPFLNARAQGLYRMGGAMRKAPAGFAVKGGLLAFASLVLWAHNREDERYINLPDWEKWSFYPFWIGEHYFRIPKPFEVGALFSTLFESAASTMAGDENIEHFAKMLKHMGMETFAMNPMPQAGRPIAEIWANKSFFTGNPIEGLADKSRRPGQRSDQYTSDTLKVIGEALDVSPKKLDAVVHGYFSTLGDGILMVSDLAARNLAGMPEKPSLHPSRYPLTGRFYRGTSARTTKYMGKFYDMVQEATETYGSVKALRDRGEMEAAAQMEKEYMDILGKRKGLNRVKRRLSEIGKRIRKIEYQRGIPGDVKAERIERLRGERLRLVKEAVGG